MTSPSDIKIALERNEKVVRARPSVGQGTARTKVTLHPGLACDVENGPWKFSVGMTEKYGGLNNGPNPGVYGRAALGACLAIGYGMWAARLDIPVRSLSVEVRANYDVRGELAVDDSIRPGYLGMVYAITVDSPASDAEITRWLDTADRYSSWLDDLRNPVPVTRQLEIIRSEG
ncbi:OsmC family protein [Mycolicibacterium sp.]|uniref:OsmC family protein n=1 Tax=Mycolicibacterium sp. TaxID=2320850 RepID=UPI0025FF91D6|nr:OsmC family protein [Mycolicibacterium sp.]